MILVFIVEEFWEVGGYLDIEDVIWFLNVVFYVCVYRLLDGLVFVYVLEYGSVFSFYIVSWMLVVGLDYFLYDFLFGLVLIDLEDVME